MREVQTFLNTLPFSTENIYFADGINFKKDAGGG